MPASQTGPIQGVRGLARAIGISHPAVSKWLKDERWPYGAGPWPAAMLPQIVAWQRNTLAPDPAKLDLTPSRKASELGELSRKADVSLKLTKQQLLQFKLDLDRGKYHKV